MKVKWTNEALDRLKEIRAQLGSSKSDNNEKLIDQIVEAAENIKKSPDCGEVVPEFKLQQLREIKINGYFIIYFVQSSLVEILTLFEESEISSRNKFFKNKFN